MQITLVTTTLLAVSLALAADASADSPVPTALQGRWTSDCAPQDRDFLSVSVGVAGNDLSLVLTHFSDAACHVPELGLTISSQFGVDGLSTDIVGAYKSSTTTHKATLTPLATDVAMSLNLFSYCGFQNWTINVPKDVTGLICQGQTMPAAEVRDFDIFQVDAQGVLYWGLRTSAFDGASPERRPIALNTANPFHRFSP